MYGTITSMHIRLYSNGSVDPDPRIPGPQKRAKLRNFMFEELSVGLEVWEPKRTLFCRVNEDIYDGTIW